MKPINISEARNRNIQRLLRGRGQRGRVWAEGGVARSWLPDSDSGHSDQNFPECFQAAAGGPGHLGGPGGPASQVAAAGRGCGGRHWRSQGQQVTQQVKEHHGAGQVLREGRGRVQQARQQEREPSPVSVRQQEQHGGDVDVTARETRVQN